MKVKVLRTFYWTIKGRHAFAGDVIDVDDELGQSLIASGYGEEKRKAGRPPSDKAAQPSEDK